MRRGPLAALAAVLALAAPAAADTPAPPPADVAIPGKYYSPGELDVLVGTTVTWHNQDVSTHTVTSDDDLFDSGPLAPGATWTRTFTKAGVYKLHCTIHRFMRGVVHVYGLVLTGPSQPLLPGAHAALRGQVPGGAAQVTLERRDPKGWTAVATRTAGQDGRYAFAPAVHAPAAFRTRSGPTVSPVLPVHVAPRVRGRIAGGSLAVTTSPARTGTVLLQVYDRYHFTFVTVARGRLGADGRAALAVRAPAGSHVRALVPGTGGWSDGASPAAVVR